MYKQTSGGVVRLSDYAFIPQADGNRDWQAYLEWVAEGNTPNPTQSADEAKAAKWESIKAERDRRTEQGGYKVDDKWFHSDQKSRAQQLNLVLLGTAITSGLQWKTMDGSFVTMTPDLAKQVIEASAASDQAVFGAAEKHKAAMEASSDPASYDFSTGWPAMFGE